MSGIAGLVYFDDRHVVEEDVNAMLAAIAHRGQDKTTSLRTANVGFVHCMLQTTPESLDECLPYQNPLNGNIITADARLDNRDQLLSQLGLDATAGQTISDSSIILACYEKWGEGCSARLVGDFAFAIWDNKCRKLFCSRDHMGIKPFYYFRSDQCFIFGSEIKAIAQTGKAQLSVNKQRVLDYLVLYHSDNDSTFYEEIKRLPAMHSLTAAGNGVRVCQYWDFSPEIEIHLKSDHEYEQAFLELFTQAVKSRLRCLPPVGAFLSGGLDSSSICCLAADILKNRGEGPLHTFSDIFVNLPQDIRHLSDEREYMDAAILHSGAAAHFVDFHEDGPLRGIDKDHYEEPMPYFNGYLVDKACAHAVNCGINVLLDGTDGDTTVSHGFERLFDLGTRFKLITLLAETKKLRHNRGKPAFSSLKILKNYCLRPYLPDIIVKRLRILLGRQPAARYSLLPRLHPDLYRHIDWDKRADQLAGDYGTCRTGRLLHYQSFVSPLEQYTMEFIDTRIARQPIELRYPFWDRRLMEFCLALPLEQKLQNGWTRAILRRAMKGILPEKIRWRPDKADLSPQFLMDIAATGDRFVDLLIKPDAKIREFIEIAGIEQQWRTFRNAPYVNNDIALDMYKLISLELWLQRHC